jgi:lysophospholipase L1-like esterase
MAAMVKRRNYYLVYLLMGILTVNSNAQTMSKEEPIRFLALGDSYTIGESVAELQRWPVQLVSELKKKGYTCASPEIIAVTGWRTDQLKKAILTSGLPRNFNLVSLLIGVNNEYQGRTSKEYESEFRDLLNLAIEYAGGNKSRVLVLSIPDYGFTPFGKPKQKEISARIDAFNKVNRSIAEGMGVTYVNITDISRHGLNEPQLVAEDGLHPSGEMYSLWVDRILHHFP